MSNLKRKKLSFAILDILRKYTDEDHRLSQKDIIDILRTEYDMTADRKSIKRNITSLMEMGYEINFSEALRMFPNKDGVLEESYILSDFWLEREFTDGELRLLIDSLLFSKHIPYNQCKELVEKLEGLSNRYFRSRIRFIRTFEESAGFSYQSKVVRCAENVYDIYRKTAVQKSAQLIFCDSSTPKKGFNLYGELQRLLMSVGIPAEEIAFIHEADTEKRRQALFAKVRSGQIRVLIGSTFKLGLGVNVQDKLVAVHHLDVPWRPADMTQREGRILRQGNENEKVQIFRYITEGSFDAYSWQLLETKQRFIVGLLSGSLEERSGSDIEDTVLDYAEIKALAVGNPLVKERVETANELTRLLTLQRKAVENHIALEKELMELPGKLTHQTEMIERCREDAAYVAATFVRQEKDIRRQTRKTLFEAVAGNALSISETKLMQYQGFEVILPSNMSKEKPYVWLQRRGRYYVELGDAEVGYMIRLDNVLEGLPVHKEKLEKNLRDMEQRQVALRAELRKKENYTDQITACKDKLRKLDKKLGVDK